MVGTTVSVKPQSWRVRWGRASDLVVPGKQRETHGRGPGHGVHYISALEPFPPRRPLLFLSTTSRERHRVMTGKEGANPLIKSESP